MATRLRTSSRSEEHTSELHSRLHLVCRLLLEKKKGESLGIETRDAAFDPLTASEERFRVRLELASRLGALAADARDLAELFRAFYDESAHVMDASVFICRLYD